MAMACFRANFFEFTRDYIDNRGALLLAVALVLALAHYGCDREEERRYETRGGADGAGI